MAKPFEGDLRRWMRYEAGAQAEAKEGCMYYVYPLRSLSHPEQKYVGITEDLKKRIAEHNSGQSIHTAKFMPWELVTYHAFHDKYKAYDFERYLKTDSGKAFATKRFW